MSYASDALIDALQRENARLRNELAMYKGSEADDVIEYLRQECASFEDMYRAEASANARLRELICDMLPYAKAFMKIGVQLGCNDSKSYEWLLKMRELGIEV